MFGADTMGGRARCELRRCCRRSRWDGLAGATLGQTVESSASRVEGVRLWAERAGSPSAQTGDGSWRAAAARRTAVVAGGF
jgi:hypothetical protein